MDRAKIWVRWARQIHRKKRTGSDGKVPTYRYMYSHVGSITTVDLFLLNPLIFLGKLAIEYFTGWKVADSDMGTCHADELFVMFQPHKWVVFMKTRLISFGWFRSRWSYIPLLANLNEFTFFQPLIVEGC